MRQYEISYWEKETVWVKRRTIVDTGHDLSAKPVDEQELKEAIENDAIEELEADYDWETMAHDDYDFDEVEIEELDKCL